MSKHMPVRTPSWTASDGSVHTNYVECLKHNLKLILAGLGENEVGAKNIVGKILDNGNIDHLVDLLTEIKKEVKSPTAFQVVSATAPTLLDSNVRLLGSGTPPAN